MSTDLNASFNEQFNNINNKIKKRFMRKPNLSEATNEFVALAIQCENSEQPSFAGQCYIGAAKCEATAGHTAGEAEYCVAAARQFMKAEKKLHSLKFGNFDRENLESAIGCFLQAINKYSPKSSLRASFYLELANDLVNLNLKREAIHYYEQALETIDSKMMELMCLRTLVNLQIECGQYDIALMNANKIADCGYSLPEDLKSEIEISRILLALIVEPEEECRPKSLDNILKQLLSNEDPIDIPISTDLHIKLQSIVVSYRTSDSAVLVKLTTDCKPLLTTQQRRLLDTIVSQDRQVVFD